MRERCPPPHRPKRPNRGSAAEARDRDVRILAQREGTRRPRATPFGASRGRTARPSWCHLCSNSKVSCRATPALPELARRQRLVREPTGPRSAPLKVGLTPPCRCSRRQPEAADCASSKSRRYADARCLGPVSRNSAPQGTPASELLQGTRSTKHSRAASTWRESRIHDEIRRPRRLNSAPPPPQRRVKRRATRGDWPTRSRYLRRSREAASMSNTLGKRHFLHQGRPSRA
mmetsp:Transcript_107704/g.303402  ORF Transcript_107704/g.303402 Transcript_107704/m.303402 type:complete len:231 (+) Transcript_107704:2023-2715(+)